MRDERCRALWSTGYWLILVDTRSLAERLEAGGQKADIFSREGLFQASQASQASQANVSGLFCNFEASQGAYWDALKSEFCPMITELGTLGRFEKKGP